MTRRPSQRVFERLAEAYRARPAYPEALVAKLLSLVPAPARVVDVGAGTGQLAAPLARAGAVVVAVEPARAMLALCAEATRGLPVTLVERAAESTGLPAGSATLVLLADAAQWVDPQAAGTEAHRLLLPGGVAAALEARPGATSFMQGLEGLLRRANPERRPQAPGRARQWLALASGGARVDAVEFQHEVPLAPEALDAVLHSLSFLAPALGPARMAAVVAEAQALAVREGGARWARILRLCWAQKSA